LNSLVHQIDERHGIIADQRMDLPARVVDGGGGTTM
jgi:hypothetical protein